MFLKTYISVATHSPNESQIIFQRIMSLTKDTAEELYL